MAPSGEPVTRAAARNAAEIPARPPRNSSSVGQPNPTRIWARGCSNQCPGPTYVPCSSVSTTVELVEIDTGIGSDAREAHDAAARLDPLHQVLTRDPLAHDAQRGRDARVELGQPHVPLA